MSSVTTCMLRAEGSINIEKLLVGRRMIKYGKYCFGVTENCSTLDWLWSVCDRWTAMPICAYFWNSWSGEEPGYRII